MWNSFLYNVYYITDTLSLHFLCCMWLETAALIQLVVLQKRTDKILAVCGTHHHTDQWSWETCHYTVPLWINGSLINIPKQNKTKNQIHSITTGKNRTILDENGRWKVLQASYWNCDSNQRRVSKLKCKKTTITDKCPQQYYLLTTRWTTIFTYTLDSSTATYQLHQILRKSPLTCLHFKGEWVFLLNGVCELEASVAAVVSVGIFSQNIGEEQVTVQAHWHPLVLYYGHNGCEEKKRIQTHLLNLIWHAIANRQQKKWCSNHRSMIIIFWPETSQDQ